MLKINTVGEVQQPSGTNARGSVNLGLAGRQGSLTKAVMHQFTQRINEGTYGAGAKLPSEHTLGRESGVSRTWCTKRWHRCAWAAG